MQFPYTPTIKLNGKVHYGTTEMIELGTIRDMLAFDPETFDLVRVEFTFSASGNGAEWRKTNVVPVPQGF